MQYTFTPVRYDGVDIYPTFCQCRHGQIGVQFHILSLPCAHNKVLQYWTCAMTVSTTVTQSHRYLPQDSSGKCAL